MNSGEIFIRRYIYTLPLLITILLVLIVGGCGSGEEQEQSRATFVSENSFGKIEGYATGHEAGQSSAFEITIFDVPQETWQGEYCLLLVDEEGVVTQLVNRPITLAGGGRILPSTAGTVSGYTGRWGLRHNVAGAGARFCDGHNLDRREQRAGTGFLGRSVEMQLVTSLSVDMGSSYTSSVSLFDS